MPRLGLIVAPVAGALSVSLSFFALFKLLSFFLVPLNVLLCFLIVGHPIGVLIGDRFYGAGLAKATAHQALILVAGVAALFLLPWIQPSLIDAIEFRGEAYRNTVLFMLEVGALYLPVFIYTGVVEVSVLRRCADDGLGLPIAYGIILGATLSGLMLGYLLLPVVGSLGLLCGALGCALLAGAPNYMRVGLGACAVGVALILGLVPAAEHAFIDGLSPTGANTVREFRSNPGAKVLSEGWGKHSYTRILERDGFVFGAYYDFVFWDVRKTDRFDVLTKGNYVLDSMVMDMVPKGGHLAIIGAGGGKQVQAALATRKGIAIDAYEIEPAVVDYFRGKHAAANGRAFQRPGVSVMTREGRGGVRSSSQPHHAIYLADPGTFHVYVKTMLMNTHFLHTVDAYRDYKASLAPNGFVATLVMRFVDRDDQLSKRIVNAMSAVGLHPMTYTNEQFRLVVGATQAAAPALEQAGRRLAATYGVTVQQMPPDHSIDNPVPTDDRGGSYIFSLYDYDSLQTFFGIALAASALLLLLLGAAAVRLSRGTLNKTLVAQSLLVGAGFVALQNAVILQMARSMLDITDAVIIGSAAFLVPAVLGALACARLQRRPTLVAAALVVLGVASIGAIRVGSPDTIVLALETGVVFIAGSYFPLIMERGGPRVVPYLFALDSLGAAFGTVTVFFVPALHGIDALVTISVILAVGLGGWLALAAGSAGAVGSRHVL